MDLAGLRTYLMGGAVILHQVLKFAGFDVSDEMMSESIDAILGLGAIFFRWRAAVAEKVKVNQALHTPVPKGGGTN